MLWARAGFHIKFLTINIKYSLKTSQIINNIETVSRSWSFFWKFLWNFANYQIWRPRSWCSNHGGKIWSNSRFHCCCFFLILVLEQTERKSSINCCAQISPFTLFSENNRTVFTIYMILIIYIKIDDQGSSIQPRSYSLQKFVNTSVQKFESKYKLFKLFSAKLLWKLKISLPIRNGGGKYCSTE